MITSTSNAQVKKIIQLNAKAKERRKSGLFVVEGRKMFQEAPDSWIEKVYVSADYEDLETVKNRQVPVEIVDPHVFTAMSDTQTPQGVLTLLKIPAWEKEQVLGGENPFLMILEDLQDPGNAGTIIRTAEGAGVTGIILTDHAVDLYNPKTIRATMGSIYRMPVLVTKALPELLGELKQRGIETYAAHLKGTHSFREENYKKPCAFLIGNEGNGLKDETAEQADHLIRIPMHGSVESLNAAIAACVLMYEAEGQREKRNCF